MTIATARLKPLAFCLLAAVATPALAANWIDLPGREPADAPLIRPWGFVQPNFTRIDAAPLAGLAGAAAALNGRTQLQNLLAPDFEESTGWTLQRAQFGLRGRITPTLTYMLLAEAGRNLTTAERPFMPLDAALSYTGLPFAKLRLGLMKRPTGHEAIVGVPRDYPYVYFSSATAALLQEAFYDDVAGTPVGCAVPSGSVSIDCARVVSGTNAFRDWGLLAHDSYARGPWEWAWAAMSANGGPPENVRDDGRRDFVARLQGSYVFKGAGAKREDAQLFVWRQAGERRYGQTDIERVREGAGFQLKRGSWRVTGEAMRGRGMIAAGRNPPVGLVDAALRPDYELNIAPHGEASGGYLEAGWRVAGPWAVDLRFDRYDRNRDDAAAWRRFDTWTLGLQYHVSENLRVTLNHEWRDAAVVHPDAIPVVAQRDNAEIIADNLGNRLALQLTWAF